MTNFGDLVMTNKVSFRDLTSFCLQIDELLSGKTEDVGALKRFEESWVLPDVKVEAK